MYLLEEAFGKDEKGAAQNFGGRTSYIWRDAYLEMIPRETNIVRFHYSTFEYIYDDYASLEATGAVPLSREIEARLVAVSGLSSPPKESP